jgi:hypothetical protein
MVNVRGGRDAEFLSKNGGFYGNFFDKIVLFLAGLGKMYNLKFSIIFLRFPKSFPKNYGKLYGYCGKPSKIKGDFFVLQKSYMENS